jgi:hypothetical protein
MMGPNKDPTFESVVGVMALLRFNQRRNPKESFLPLIHCLCERDPVRMTQ